MSAKKDFSALNTERVYAAIGQATAEEGKRSQSEAAPREREERAAEMRTQGRKGCKALRINMAFTPQNHTYLETAARRSGMTMTQFVNALLEYCSTHPETVAAAVPQNEDAE